MAANINMLIAAQMKRPQFVVLHAIPDCAESGTGRIRRASSCRVRLARNRIELKRLGIKFGLPRSNQQRVAKSLGNAGEPQTAAISSSASLRSRSRNSLAKSEQLTALS